MPLSVLILLLLFEGDEARFELHAMLVNARAPLFEIAEFDDLCLIGVDQTLLFAPKRAKFAFEPVLLLLFGCAITLVLPELILFEQ